MSESAIGGSPSVATLARLAEGLGPGVVTMVTAPRGLDVHVSEAVIFDATLPGALERGDVVLGVGVRPDQASAPDLISAAGEAESAAVVFKLPRDGPTRRLREAAHKAGTAVLAIPPDMAWGRFHTLVRTALLGVGPTLPPSPEGVAVGDLFALANAVAAHVGGAVTIEDTQLQVLAYSSLDQPIDGPRRELILTRRYPDSWAKKIYESGVIRQLSSSSTVIRLEGWPGLAPRMAIAIRAGSEMLGSIWVLEGRRELGPEAEDALVQAAQVAALHLIRHGRAEDLERRRRGEMLHALLDGRSHPETVAVELGLEPRGEFTVVAFELQSVDDTDLVQQRERALGFMALYFEAYRRRTAAAAIGRAVYVLLPLSGKGEWNRPLSVAADVMRHTEEAVGVSLRVGVGSTVADLRETPASREEADQVLRVMRTLGGPAVADIDAVRAHAILLELRDLAADRPLLRTGRLQPLITHDGRRGTSYLDSLRAYLDARGDVMTAAEILGVHPNTLRYRIRRVAEISGLDLDSPEERLVAELQLRLM